MQSQPVLPSTTIHRDVALMLDRLHELAAKYPKQEIPSEKLQSVTLRQAGIMHIISVCNNQDYLHGLSQYILRRQATASAYRPIEIVKNSLAVGLGGASAAGALSHTVKFFKIAPLSSVQCSNIGIGIGLVTAGFVSDILKDIGKKNQKMIDDVYQDLQKMIETRLRDLQNSEREERGEGVAETDEVGPVVSAVRYRRGGRLG